MTVEGGWRRSHQPVPIHTVRQWDVMQPVGTPAATLNRRPVRFQSRIFIVPSSLGRSPVLKISCKVNRKEFYASDTQRVGGRGECFWCTAAERLCTLTRFRPCSEKCFIFRHIDTHDSRQEPPAGGLHWKIKYVCLHPGFAVIRKHMRWAVRRSGFNLWVFKVLYVGLG